MTVVAADRWASRAVAIAVVILGAAPIAALIPGGLRDGAYAARWAEWGYGTAIVVGVAAAVALLARRRATDLESQWKAACDAMARFVDAHDATCTAALVSGAVAVYAAIAVGVFSSRPLLIDELVQVLQAQTYASGHLSVPTPAAREFFSVLHVVDLGARTYSQFPPGWPAMLAAAIAIHLPTWLIGPLCGGVAVYFFRRLLAAGLPTMPPATQVFVTALFAAAPFTAFQFGSHMSHGPELMWLLIGLDALVRFDLPDVVPNAHVRHAVVFGVAFGAAFAVRPLDAVAFAAVAGPWFVVRAGRRGGAMRSIVAAAVGAAPSIAAVMFVNAATTGHPFQFGYEALWGPLHGLGFHAAPWGDAHTPARGVELLSAYVTRLNTYLFETPFPSLAFAVVGLFLVDRLAPVERLIGAATLVHAACYFAYWHDGFYLGPRFIVPWLPALILASWRGLRAMPMRPVFRIARRAALATAVVLTVAASLPVRVTQYRAGLSSMREDYGAAAVAAGARRALVFVRESWGAELMARMWALGVSRPASAALYAHVDACALEHGIASVERAGARDSVASAMLEPLLRDSARVVSSTISPDSTERMLPGATYDSACVEHVERDRAGYALYPPFLLDRESGNIYARDLMGRDSVLMKEHPDRDVYEVSRDGVDGTSPLKWVLTRKVSH